MAEETKAENTAAQVETKNLQRETPKSGGGGKKLGKIIMWVILGVILLIGALVAVAFFSTRGVSDAADEVMAQLQAQECEEIYANTTETFRQFTDAETWNEECLRVSGVLTGEPEQKGVSVETASNDVTTGVATYRVEGNNGITYEVGMTFVGADDGYELDSLTSLPEDAVEAAEEAEDAAEEGETTDGEDTTE